jgi:hypothetical protein
MPITRQPIAASLAALAAFGFVLAPVFHAQLHASEAEQEHDRALAAMFQVAFEQERGPGWSAALAEAVARALGDDDDAALSGIENDHHHGKDQGLHRHSHGPGQHGAGSLEHFALAVHAAPNAPVATPPERVPDGSPLSPVTLHLTPRYLVPNFSQGPPRA